MKIMPEEAIIRIWCATIGKKGHHGSGVVCLAKVRRAHELRGDVSGRQGGIPGRQGDASGKRGGAADRPGGTDVKVGDIPGKRGVTSDERRGVPDKRGGSANKRGGAAGCCGSAPGNHGGIADRREGASGNGGGTHDMRGNTPGEQRGLPVNLRTGNDNITHPLDADPGKVQSMIGILHYTKDIPASGILQTCKSLNTLAA
jgi:hypothetical protein